MYQSALATTFFEQLTQQDSAISSSFLFMRIGGGDGRMLELFPFLLIEYARVRNVSADFQDRSPSLLGPRGNLKNSGDGEYPCRLHGRKYTSTKAVKTI